MRVLEARFHPATRSGNGFVVVGRVIYLIPLRAPIDGTVIRRTVTLGQAVERSTDAVLAVPKDAIQRVEGVTIVFVKKSDGFERRAVEPGITGGSLIEVRSGLKEGEEVAMGGTFLLKSELLR